MFDKKYGIPEEQTRYLQMLFDRLGLSNKQRTRVLDTYMATASWDEPVMPIIVTHLAASVKGDTVADHLKQGMDDMAAAITEFITTIETRNEFIRTESQAVDQALQHANDEFSRKLAKLNDRLESSVETIEKSQAQLLQMYQQVVIRSRQTLRGKLQNYVTGAIVGFAFTLLIQNL